MVQLGSPIMVSLANKIISFSCNITYPCTPEFQAFKFGFYYVNLQDQQSSEEKIPCQPSVGTENQTCTTKCQVTATLPSSSATGTYYCSVRWPSSKKRGSGTFILVRGEASSVALPRAKAQRFHAAEFRAQDLKWGMLTPSFSFDKTDQSVLGELLATQVLRHAPLCAKDRGLGCGSACGHLRDPR